MMKGEIEKAFRKLGRLLGIQEVKGQQAKILRILLEERHLLNKAISYLEFASIDQERIETSTQYRPFHQFISLLSPMDVQGGNYRRVGKDHDGGYVMLDEFSSNNVDAAYSFGINNDVSWDMEIAKEGIDVFMYDHTIDSLPGDHPRFHFFKKGVTGYNTQPDLDTLGALISKNGHQDSNNLLLKMDIENNEWDVFDETTSDTINQFSQIVIELHQLNPNQSQEHIDRAQSVLKKINQTHQAIHVHANGFCKINWLAGLALPLLLEVTYIRRSDHKDRLTPNTRTFPTPIDQSTFSWLPDVPLDAFSMPTFDQANKSTQPDDE